MKLLNRLSIYGIVCVALCACGGGGGSGTPPAATAPAGPILAAVSNAVPTANAGTDQTVLVGATTILDGGASSDANGDPLTYNWRLTTKPVGSTAALSAVTAVRPQITVDMEGVFTLALTVSDGKSESAIDSVSINATKPVASNVIPVANPGANQNVTVGTTVALDGTASVAQNAKGLTYRWIFVSKPLTATLLVNAATSKPTFIADTIGTYTVGLVVNNSVADSIMATTVITATAPPTTANSAPIANAGIDQIVVTGATVNVDGTLSKDPNGDRLAYAWTLLSKPALSTALLSSSSLISSSFRADLSGVYEVRLSVNDGKLDSVSSDVITIVATPPSATVVPDTGTYRCSALTKDQASALYAAGHTYLDRDHDGKPCEANDLLNELASPYIAPAPSNTGKCWVNGYTRKNGTRVNGYYRSC